MTIVQSDHEGDVSMKAIHIRYVHVLVAAVAVCFGSSGVHAFAVSGGNRTQDEAALHARERQYTEGILKKDIPLLRTVFAPTFVDTGASGKIQTRDQFLNSLEKSSVEIDSLAVEEPRIDFYGGTAVVTERFHVVYTAAGKQGVEDGRATDVWVKMRGKWMCVAAHSSQIQ